MRVLHLISSMGGGGAERQLSYIASGLVDAGVGVTVAHIKGGPNYRRLRASGATVVQLNERYGYAGIMLKFASLIRRTRPDVVQTWLSNMDIVGGFAALSMGSNLIISERSNRSAGYSVRFGLAHQFVASRARAIVGNSRTGLRYWRKKLGSSAVLQYIPNCLPMSEIDSVDMSLSRAVFLHKERRWIMFAGRLLDDPKNLRLLVEVWSKIGSIDRKIGFVIAGTGPDRVLLDPLKKELRERLIHYDYLPERELWALMKRASLLMSFSRFEGSPNVAMEAMACGVPIVLSNIPEHREILDDDSAVFAESGNARGFVEAATSVLSTEAEAKQDAARRRAELYSVPATAAAYVQLYARLVKTEE
jgi:glycosyltransferase involved in cell wall biosynthesis